MERIKSFEIDHNLLDPGFYISREDGDVITYDLRTRKPNMGEYMDNATMHSLEHMFATMVRNSAVSDQVVYFGPMGCQTGFYLLVRDAVKPMEVFELTKKIKKALAKVHDVDVGDIMVENIDTTIFNKCIDVKYSYPSATTMDLVNGKKTIDLNSL